MSSALDEALARFAAAAGHDGAAAFASGTSLMCAGRVAEAAPMFQVAVAQTGAHQLKSAYSLGLAWARVGHVVPAEFAFRRLIEQTDALLAPFVELGLLLLAGGRYTEALELYEVALVRHIAHPDLARVVVDAAVAYDALLRYDEGVALCRRAINDLGLREPLIWRNMGVFLLRIEDHETSRSALRTAVSIAPRLGEEIHGLWAQWGDGRPL